jgi:histidine ammonia-lyase
VTAPVDLDGGPLSIAELVRAARGGAEVRLTAAAAGRVERAHARLRELCASGTPIYGVTTGVGALERDRPGAGPSEEERQRALLRSHAAGVGAPMADDEVRAMMLARANTLAKGMSGVSPATLDRLLALVARGVTPVVPELGSVGASDLAPLAHVGLALVGEGRARHDGSELPAAEALARAGLAPARLTGRDGLALVNGLAQSAALGALAAHDALSLIELGEATAAMTLSAVGAPRDFLDERLAEAKGQSGQKDSARAMRRLLGDDIRRPAGGPLRAPLSLRYAPQVTGAARSALAFATAAVEAELGAAADNPLLLDDGSLCSNSATTGGQELAQALDLLAAAIVSLAVASERRAAALLDGSVLPLALRHPRARAGVDSGLLIAQYTAAALVAELRVRGGAAGAHSIPTCPGEDHVSMSALAARQARLAVERARTVVAIELLCACQGVDVAGAALSPPLALLHARVRARVPVWIEDRFLADDITGTLAALWP